MVREIPKLLAEGYRLENHQAMLAIMMKYNAHAYAYTQVYTLRTKINTSPGFIEWYGKALCLVLTM